MKKRTVIIQLELETDEPLRCLRDRTRWQETLRMAGVRAEEIGTYDAIADSAIVRQVTASVAQPPRKDK